MARKSLANVVLESNMRNFQDTSSPLRRKSIIIQKTTPQVFSENDDEAERLALRREIVNTTVNSTPSTNGSEKRHSLTLGLLAQMSEPQITERITQCIKLSAENKINIKNAFSLEMIDFITFMVTKTNSEVTNLQVASTSLDVCTKIYGFRVDGIYSQILKMVGALEKQKEDESVNSEIQQSENVEENDSKQAENRLKKKKKKNKQIFTTEDAINGCVETLCPLQTIMGSGDLCSSDMLYEVVLPHHVNSGFYYHPYNDVILDVLDEKNTNNENPPEYTIPVIENFSDLDLCSSFTDFEFLKWSPEDEPEISQPTQETNDNRFQFDLDGSIPSADEQSCDRMNFFDIGEDIETVNNCIRIPEQAEHIVDLRKVIAVQVPEHQKTSEYTFIQKNLNLIHWAGPTYWKVKTFNKLLSNSKVIETCHQVALPKKKKIDFQYIDDIKSELEKKLLPSRVSKLQVKTAKVDWSEMKITLPEDIHHEVSQLLKLYLCPLLVMNKEKNKLNETQLSDDIENYDYNNEKDMSDYCPGIGTADCDMQERNDFDELRDRIENGSGTQMAFTGDNLVAAPALINKIFMQYPLRAKKIDMRQLKKTIWKTLTTGTGDQTDVQKAVQNENTDKIEEAMPFSTVYKTLPDVLSKTNFEALSIPIALVSLLHLANEKSLKLSSLPDMTDIIVEKN